MVTSNWKSTVHTGGRIDHHGWARRSGASKLALSRDPLVFLESKTLDLLVIDVPAFTAGIMIGGPIATPSVLLGVVA